MVSHRGERLEDEHSGGSSNSNNTNSTSRLIHRVKVGKIERSNSDNPSKHHEERSERWRLKNHLSDLTAGSANDCSLQQSNQSNDEVSHLECEQSHPASEDMGPHKNISVSNDSEVAARWKRHKDTLAALDVSVNGIIDSMISNNVSSRIRPPVWSEDSVTDQAVTMAIRHHGLYTCGTSQSVTVPGINEPPAHLLERAVLSEAVSLAIQRKGLQQCAAGYYPE